ncbi:hypothetical protein AB0D74_41560 [Streptomyces sp. NPDC048278]|uniref:GlsB/YeaQ/YmgE family stress response membrane protein n=1 Tax=Streptomyces sp. NPDC048278 TaxID=3155809 RepID=UPI00343B0828
MRNRATFGLFAGAVAQVLLPGRDPGGLIGTTLIGAAIAGSPVLLVDCRLLFGNSRD